MVEVIVSKKFIMNFWRLFAAAEAACLSARMSRVRKIGWRVEMEIGSLRASRDHHRVMRVASLEHSINAWGPNLPPEFIEPHDLAELEAGWATLAT